MKIYALHEKYSSLLQIGYKVAELGQIEQIDEVLERASNIILSATSKSIAFILMELGQYDRAFEIARSAENEEDLSNLVNIYAEMKNYTQAFEVVESIRSSYIKVEALTDLASSYFKAGNKERASELIDRALEIARNAKSDSEEESDAECGGSLIQIIAPLCSDMAEYDRLLPEIEAIEDWNIQAQILNNLLRELDIGENLELFDKILTRVCQVARNIPDKNTRGVNLTHIGYIVADRYASIGRYDRALSTIASIEDLTTRASAFAILARKYAEKGDRVDLQTKKALETIVENVN